MSKEVSNRILAFYAAEDNKDRSQGYTPVPYNQGRSHLWVRLVDVSDAADELEAAQAGELPGEAFIDTIHLPIN